MSLFRWKTSESIITGPLRSGYAKAPFDVREDGLVDGLVVKLAERKIKQVDHHLSQILQCIGGNLGLCHVRLGLLALVGLF